MQVDIRIVSSTLLFARHASILAVSVVFLRWIRLQEIYMLIL